MLCCNFTAVVHAMYRRDCTDSPQTCPCHVCVETYLAIALVDTVNLFGVFISVGSKFYVLINAVFVCALRSFRVEDQPIDISVHMGNPIYVLVPIDIHDPCAQLGYEFKYHLCVVAFRFVLRCFHDGVSPFFL